MKLNEIMVIRNIDNETRLKLFQVDDDTLAKLTRIRGRLFKDDPRLTLVKDLPEHKKPVENLNITPEMRKAAEDSFRLHQMIRDAKPVTSLPIVKQPEPKPMTFEEQLAHDWRFDPGIRKEFISFGSYQAFKRMEKEGRTRLYGFTALRLYGFTALRLYGCKA